MALPRTYYPGVRNCIGIVIILSIIVCVFSAIGSIVFIGSIGFGYALCLTIESLFQTIVLYLALIFIDMADIRRHQFDQYLSNESVTPSAPLSRIESPDDDDEIEQRPVKRRMPKPVTNIPVSPTIFTPNHGGSDHTKLSPEDEMKLAKSVADEDRARFGKNH